MNDTDFVGVVADTNALWLCGASYLPSIAVIYAVSAGHLGRAAALAPQAFYRTSPGCSSGNGPVAPALTELRDEFHRMLGESVDNLFATGDALEKIAWSYANTDGHNAAALAETVKTHLDANAKNLDQDKRIWTDAQREERIKTPMQVPPKGN